MRNKTLNIRIIQDTYDKFPMGGKADIVRSVLEKFEPGSFEVKEEEFLEFDRVGKPNRVAAGVF